MLRGHGRSTTLLILVAAFALLSALPDAAADQRDLYAGIEFSDDPNELIWLFPEYVVEGTRLFGPYSVTQIDAEVIEETGARDLSEALELVPGIAVRTNSRGEANLSMRGLSERELVVLVDGVPISDAYTGAVNTALMPAGAIDRVTVTRGPVASVYGANAIGGVVEVTTARPDGTGLGYFMSTGSDGRYSGYVSVSTSVQGVALTGGVATNGSDDFTLPDSYEGEDWEDGGERDFSDYSNTSAWARASWALAKNLDASVSFQIAENERDAPASTSSDRPRFWSFPYWRETRTIGSVRWEPSSSMFVEGRAFLGTNDNQLASHSDFERTDRQWLSTMENKVYGGYVYSEMATRGGHNVAVGVNVKVDDVSQQDDVGEEWSEYEATTVSLFGQDVFELGENDRLAIAANVDAMSGDDVNLASFNPQASWTRRFGAGMSVRLLGGIKTRFPTLKEWFSPSIGNPDLDPEKSVSLETEFTKKTDWGARFSVLAYGQWIEDMIVSSGKHDPCENVGKVTTLGTEFAAAYRVSKSLELGLGLEATSARDDETEQYLEYIPRSAVTATARYTRGRAGVFARLERVGTRPEDGEEDLPAYVLLDVRGTYDTRWGALFLGVNNVFDELYEDGTGYPQPGRSVKVGISRELNQ